MSLPADHPRFAVVKGSAAIMVAVIVLQKPGLAAEASSGTHDYLVNVWQTSKGLPENLVSTILQTRDGYLWVGTFGGLARFDGARFVTFGVHNSAGFRHNRISNLYEDRKGDLWIGSDGGGLTRYHAGQFINYGTQQGLRSDFVTCLGEDELGGVWTSDYGDGLNRWQNERITAHLRSELPVKLRNTRQFQADDSGQVWVTKGGVRECRLPRKLVRLSGYSQVVEDRAGRLWIHGPRFAARLLADDRAGEETHADPCLESDVSCFLEDKDSGVWVGTLSHGLFHWLDGQSSFERIEGISDVQVRTIYEDREGNIWVGTTSGGLNRVRRPAFEIHSVKEGLTGKDVLTVTKDKAGRLWAGTYRDGPFYGQQEQEQRWSFKPTQRAFHGASIWSVCATRDGALWVGTWSAGLFRIKDNEFAEFSQRNGLSDSEIQALYEDRDGSLWIGTHSGGLDHFDGKEFVSYGPREGLTGKYVTSILRTRDGALWVGSNGGGVFRMVNGRFTGYSIKEGLSSSIVLALYEDEDSHLWIGTQGNGGLSRWTGGRVTNLTRESGLASDAIKSILEDASGNLWLGSNRGIIRVRKKELNDVVEGKATWLHAMTYGEQDGMSNVECRGGTQPAACKTEDGQLWFATHEGLVSIDPSRIYSNSVVPPVIIEEVLVDGRRAEAFGVSGTEPPKVELMPNQRACLIRYSALSFRSPEKVQFRYQMEGLDKDWTEAGPGREALYQYLPAGNYRFHVVACSESGIWSEAGASLNIRRLPAFWETRWFLGLVGIGAALTIGGSVRLVTKRRMREKLERLERQRALEVERTRIARDIHDEVGASLTRISKMAEILDEPSAPVMEDQPALRDIAVTANKTIQAMDEIVWAINPKKDTLDDMASYLIHFTKEFLRSSAVPCEFDVPLSLPDTHMSAELRHNLLMTVKEALNNAVKHAAPRQIRLAMEVTGKALTIKVVDDGKGFDLHGVRANGNGLDNMKKRLGIVGGEFQLRSTPGQGTTVEMRVWLKQPLRSQSQ